ncbi:unnamed protein product [Didymodactylos carnosus]|uniref:SCP domain-containing protein n=1 Tax=Didymodactylos carnosus TaxID=1234261 RepID=A0A8S2ITV4_9BILA|nr:unnamed protein product [Didymodactylos carnosus]CAF3778772.1 unnamed protein product [Didymodactylos carnosus]
MQNELVDKHNEYRSAVEASNMLKIYHDPLLADMAQTHCNLCSYDYGLAKNCIIPEYGWKNGQIMLLTMNFNESAADLLSTLLDGQQQLFVYGQGCIGFELFCHEYTLAMLAGVNRIGVGQTDCLFQDAIAKLYCINYIQAQYTDSYTKPYKQGARCSECPDNCDRKLMLCDCKDKLCPNGQVLDPSTCNCILSSRPVTQLQEDISISRMKLLYDVRTLDDLGQQ